MEDFYPMHSGFDCFDIAIPSGHDSNGVMFNPTSVVLTVQNIHQNYWIFKQ